MMAVGLMAVVVMMASSRRQRWQTLRSGNCSACNDGESGNGGGSNDGDRKERKGLVLLQWLSTGPLQETNAVIFGINLLILQSRSYFCNKLGKT